MGKASEIWKEIKPKIGEMLVAVNDIETQAEKAQEEAYQKGLSDGKNQDAKDFADMYDSGYSEGLKDAWECARKIAINEVSGGLSLAELDKIFSCDDLAEVFGFTASEAIKKIRQYEQESEEKITKGDVVRIKSAPEVEILVTYADEEHVSGIALTEVDGCCKIGDQYTDIVIHKVEKTGSHYEIAEVLRKVIGK